MRFRELIACFAIAGSAWGGNEYSHYIVDGLMPTLCVTFDAGNARDTSPWQRDGTEYGSVTYGVDLAHPSPYAEFGGSGDYILFPDIEHAGLTSATACAWVRVDTDKNPSFLFGVQNSNATYRYTFACAAYAGDVSCFAGNGTSSYWQYYIGDEVLREWVHIAMTWDNDVIEIYANGEPTTETISRDQSGIPLGSGGTFSVGRDEAATARDLDGAIDDVLFYPHCLTASQVKRIYNSSLSVGRSYQWWIDQLSQIVGQMAGGELNDGLETDGTHYWLTSDSQISKYNSSGSLVSNCTDYTLCKDGIDLHFGGLEMLGTSLYAVVSDNLTSGASNAVIRIDPETLHSISSVDLGVIDVGVNLIAHNNGYWYLGESASGITNPVIHVLDSDWNYLGECAGTVGTDLVGWQDGVVCDGVLYAMPHYGMLHAYTLDSATSATLRTSRQFRTTYGEGIAEVSNRWFFYTKESISGTEGIYEYKRNKSY